LSLTFSNKAKTFSELLPSTSTVISSPDFTTNVIRDKIDLPSACSPL
jgi:hypothetical protein